MAAAADYSYLESTGRPIFYKSNSSEIYETCGESRDMGVLVTGPWPMSQPIYDRPNVSVPLQSSVSRRSVRGSKEDCLNCRNQQQHQNHHHSNNQLCNSESFRNVRPFSVPPSLGRMSSGSLNYVDGNQMELIPLGPNSQQASAVPSRAMLNGLHPTSPPTCVPWLKKMKVIKKIQRKIGIGNRGGGISPNNLPPLLFNNVHGENVTISQNGAVARRTNSFCKGIAFSDRAVKINEKVCIKFVELSKSWSGVLRFGFTSHDPSTLRNGLPRYACPDLTSKPGFWAKAFSDLYVKKDGILYFYVNSAGDVYFGINGEEKGLFFSGVDTRGPLWVLIDIYGNTTGLEFVDPRSQLNNSRPNVSETQSQSSCHLSSTSLQSESHTQIVVPPPPSDPYKLPAAAVSKVIAMFPQIALNVDHFNPLTKGKHAIVAGSVGGRREGEYSNAYIFPNQPLRAGETIVIYVQEVDYAYASSMAFGLTSCNPKEISHIGFPDDAYRLLDRPEYWVVEKDVANSPCEGDVIAFTISPEGEVIMTKNNEQPKILMHVDNSVPLFPFFDLYGTTTQIQLAGIIPSNHYRPRLPLENGRCRTTKYYDYLRRSSSLQAASPYYDTLERNVPHSVSAVNCSPSKVGVGASSSSSHCHSAATLAAMTTNEKNAVTYATLNKVTGPKHSPAPAPSRDPPNWSIECVACCERPVDSVFYSCGHMCMCYQCAVEYWKTKEKGCCPICRATISDVIRTYKS